MTESESAGRRRDPVEALLEEYLAQYRRGDAEPIEQFVERSANAHPDYAARIRELLPQLAELALDLESASANTPTEAPLLEPGQQIRHYRVERYIGRGGMSEIYLAQNTKLGSDVAFKLLNARFSDDPQLLAAFEREARMAAHLDHPNIAIVHDFFEVDDRHYLVMEFVEGESLGALLKKEKPVALAKLLDLGVQIAQGLASAHNRNIIHRDLKPDNVMITSDGRAKILDFGLAKVDETESPASSRLGTSVFSAGTVLGTVGYMSPEQARGQPVDARSDIFALGVVLYEMATGTAPFLRATCADTISAILNDEPQATTTVNPEVPYELGLLIDRLLEKKPEDRPQSSDAVLEELEGLRAPPHRPSLSMKILKVVAPLALVAALIPWFLPSDQPEPPAPDPRIAELREFLDRDIVSVPDTLEARSRLEALEADLGPNGSLRALLKKTIDTALERGLANLELELATGDRNAASRRADLEKLAADDPRAGELAAEAQELGNGVQANRDAVARYLEDGQLWDAWTVIKALRGETFRQRAFKPATDAARTLKEELIESLESQLNAPKSDDRFADHVALLREVHPSHPELAGFTESLNEALIEADVQQRLADSEVFAAADPGRVWEVKNSEAQGIVRGLEGLLSGFPESKGKKEVEKRLETWESAGEIYAAFVKPPHESASLPDAVRSAKVWRESLERAFREPPARDALKQLERQATNLAPRFREGAADLLGKLRVRIQVSEADAETRERIEEAERLVEAIVERSLKLQPPTRAQKEQLARLRSEPKLDESLFEPVDRARERLKRRRADADRREEEWRKLRRALRKLELEGLKLEKIVAGWRRERGELDAAIAFAPVGDFKSLNAGLAWDRSLVNLRLGRYPQALDDIRASGRGRKLEGLLRSGLAELGGRRFTEAAKYFREALRMNARSARAHYGLGTSLSETDSAADALAHLERAPSFADAHYQLAVLHRSRRDHPRAIASADRYLKADAGFSEDEMVTVFADVRIAKYGERAKSVRCDVYLVRADGYFHTQRYAACIRDCTAIVSLRPTRGEAYFWRAWALHETGASRARVEADLRRAEKNGYTKKAQELRKLIGSG